MLNKERQQSKVIETQRTFGPLRIIIDFLTNAEQCFSWL